MWVSGFGIAMSPGCYGKDPSAHSKARAESDWLTHPEFSPAPGSAISASGTLGSIFFSSLAEPGESTFPESLRLVSSVAAEPVWTPNSTPLMEMAQSNESSTTRLFDDIPSQMRSEPDISKPGPDLGDYPNSAYTLPKGRIYVESAPFGYRTGNQQIAAAYAWQFLLRYGLTDDVELRVLGFGLTSIDWPGDRTTGFSPLILDTKVHLWDEQMDRLVPAAALEVSIQTNWASKAFQAGVQPSLNLNLDFPFTEFTNLEMTFGLTTSEDPAVGSTSSFQWAVEHELSESLQIFLHGNINRTIFPGSGLSDTIGVGYFYKFSTRTMLFNSYNAAIDGVTAPFTTQLGLAIAF
jgi:hypothetical protein